MHSPLDAVNAEYDLHFCEYWNRIFSECREAASDRVWFAGPSSYVFFLAGQRFAVDLQIRRNCDFEALKSRLHEDAALLSSILITHPHDDHMCLPLMRELKDTPIRWYIPAETDPALIERAGLRAENITYVRAGDRWQMGPLSVRAFYSPHVEPGKDIFPQCGYEITSPRGKLLLPGDVRDYSFEDYPDFGFLDTCFSHLWAGNDALDVSAYRPVLEQFADFYSRFYAKRYFFCHLYELGRPERFLWTYAHAGLAMDAFLERLPGSVVQIPRLGQSYSLFPEQGDSGI